MISFILKVFSFDIIWRLTIDSGFFHFRFIKPLITWKRLWKLFTSNCGEWGRVVFIYCFWLMNKLFNQAKQCLFLYFKSFLTTFFQIVICIFFKVDWYIHPIKNRQWSYRFQEYRLCTWQFWLTDLKTNGESSYSPRVKVMSDDNPWIIQQLLHVTFIL